MKELGFRRLVFFSLFSNPPSDQSSDGRRHPGQRTANMERAQVDDIVILGTPRVEDHFDEDMPEEERESVRVKFFFLSYD